MKKTYDQLCAEGRARAKAHLDWATNHPDYPKVAAEVDAEYDFVRTMAKAKKEARLTQTELAKRLGVSQPTISDTLRNPNVTVETFVRILAACNKRVRLVCEDLPQQAQLSH